MSAILLLRTCGHRGEAHGGFVWPLEVGARVEAPDWDAEPRCGSGLHGLPWGEGDGGLLSWKPDAKWLVVEADEADVVRIDHSKAKFRACVIRHVGDRLSATTFIVENGARGRSVVGYTATAGDRGTATAGYRGTATAGDGGTATAGYGGTATAGDGGTATAGDGGTATAGDGGTVAVRWWDEKASRYRVAFGEVGEGGITAGVAYRVVGGKLVEKRKEGAS